MTAPVPESVWTAERTVDDSVEVMANNSTDAAPGVAGGGGHPRSVVATPSSAALFNSFSFFCISKLFTSSNAKTARAGESASAG